MNVRASFRTAAALMALLTIGVPAISGAHGVVVDGMTGEWFGTPPPTANSARIARAASGSGELVWRDVAGDTHGSPAARACDLLELRVTGDPDTLYLLARFTSEVPVSGDSVVQLQVAFDLNRFYNLGGTAFLGDGSSMVAPEAAYEYLLQTRFGSGQPPRLVDSWGNEQAVTLPAVLSASGAIEIAVPWSALGLAYPSPNAVRISTAVFLGNAADEVLAPGDATWSKATDVVTQYGLVSGGTTVSEMADGELNHSLDAVFSGRGECVAPILVNEVYFEGGVHSQWIEVVNATQGMVALSQFKLGDAETPGSNEGMAQFPAGMLLGPGEVAVVAYRGSTFLAEQGFHANAECDGSDSGTPDMLPFAGWASNVVFNIPNAGDAVLVLDRSNTVVDVVTYKNASYPGVVARAGAPALHSLERLHPGLDTDNCSADFADLLVPTPASAVQATGVGDGGPLVWQGAWPVPSHGRMQYRLALKARAPLRVEIVDLGGRAIRTLFDGMGQPGTLALAWDGLDASGRAAPSGVYFASARQGREAHSLRTVLIR